MNEFLKNIFGVQQAQSGPLGLYNQLMTNQMAQGMAQPPAAPQPAMPAAPARPQNVVMQDPYIADALLSFASAVGANNRPGVSPLTALAQGLQAGRTAAREGMERDAAINMQFQNQAAAANREMMVREATAILADPNATPEMRMRAAAFIDPKNVLPTEAQRNFQAFQTMNPQQRAEFQQYQAAQRPVTNVNVGAGEREITKQLAQGDAGRVNKMAESVDSMRSLGTALEEFQNVLENTNFQTGAAADQRLLAGQIADTLGLQRNWTEDTSDAEVMRSITNQIAPTLRVPGSGATTDKDINLFLSSLPNITTTPDGNRKIIGYLQRIIQRREQEAEVARSLLESEGSLRNLSFRLKGLPDLFSDEERKDLRNSGMRKSGAAKAPARESSTMQNVRQGIIDQYDKMFNLGD